MNRLELQQKTQLSRELAAKIREQRRIISENNTYLREQQIIINETIDFGNNHIAQLTRESDELVISINQSKVELINLNSTIDNRKFELLSLG